MAGWEKDMHHFKNLDIASLAPPPLTPREINQRNRRFRRQQSKLLVQRASDEFVLNMALEDIQAEALRMPFKSVKTLEGALADVKSKEALFEARFATKFAKRGGSASKTDALQRLILEVARKNPGITTRGLQDALSRIKILSIVTDIDEGFVYFKAPQGREAKAPLSGLKDRLSRAKKKIKDANIPSR